MWTSRSCWGDLLAAAEVDACLAAGLVGRHAGGFVVAGEGVDVEGYFAVEIAVGVARRSFA
jgi:hypothetical protein